MKYISKRKLSEEHRNHCLWFADKLMKISESKVSDKLKEGFKVKSHSPTVNFEEVERNLFIIKLRDKAKAKGMAKGEAKAKIEMVRNMLKNNFAIEDIAKVSDLSIAEVLALKE
jgi:predicted transposase/invertase (TIGR01784 family)